VTPLLPLGLGLVALAAGFALLRSFGARYRFGRLLATAPLTTVAEAVEIARSGHPRYVRVDGRIDSESEFEDAEHRPLVVRHTRFEARVGGRWKTFETVHEGVPFEVREGLDGIAVDHDAVADGLVVVRRESTGVVRDLGDRAPADIPRDAPARVVVEHVSSVEHATVAGVPATGPTGVPMLRAGLGRPLILTTLELDEAMRVLSDGGVARVRAAAAALGAGGLLVVVGLVWAAAEVLT
jgi:hypothetical protein